MVRTTEKEWTRKTSIRYRELLLLAHCVRQWPHSPKLHFFCSSLCYFTSICITCTYSEILWVATYVWNSPCPLPTKVFKYLGEDWGSVRDMVVTHNPPALLGLAAWERWEGWGRSGRLVFFFFSFFAGGIWETLRGWEERVTSAVLSSNFSRHSFLPSGHQLMTLLLSSNYFPFPYMSKGRAPAIWCVGLQWLPTRWRLQTEKDSKQRVVWPLGSTHSQWRWGKDQMRKSAQYLR